MNATAVVCDRCLSHALVECIACKEVCCLICSLSGEICDCGHHEKLHGLTEHMRGEGTNGEL